MPIFQWRNTVGTHYQNSRKIWIVVVVIFNYTIDYLRRPVSSFNDMYPVSEILLPFPKAVCGGSETSIPSFIRYN